MKHFFLLILLSLPYIQADELLFYKEPDQSRIREILDMDNPKEQERNLYGIYKSDMKNEEAFFFLTENWIINDRIDSLYTTLIKMDVNMMNTHFVSNMNSVYHLIEKEYKINSLYRFLNKYINAIPKEKHPYLDFLKAFLLFKKNMNKAAANLIYKNESFFLKNQIPIFFHLGGKIAYHAEDYRHSIRLLGKSYQTRPSTGTRTLIELAALKGGLSEQETRDIFTRLAKTRLEKAPDFKINNLQGEPYQLSNVNNKHLLLVFWASWCGPCRHELPAVNQLYHEKNNDLEIWSINIEGDSLKAANLKNRLSLDFPILLDDGYVQSLYTVTSIPRAILINPKGEIILKIIGGTDDLKSIVLNRMKLFE